MLRISIVPILLSGVLLCPTFADGPQKRAAQTPAAQTRAAQAPATKSRAAALAIIGGLPDEARARAVLPFASAERRDWHYVPRTRPGLPLSDLDLTGRERVQNLMRAILSESGLLKVNSVPILEGILRELEGGAVHRNPENYSLVIFGDPAGDAPWGWRFEGHHLSIGFTFEGETVRGVTPFFLGANPAVVPRGEFGGQRFLATEEELALDLMASLDEEERKTARIDEKAPRDVLYGPGQARPESLGVSYQDLDPAERALLWALVRLYAHNLCAETAAEVIARIESEGRDGIRFAWAGPMERWALRYYRISGPTFVIELDRTGANPGHVHALWRDPERDFGGDILEAHRRTEQR